MPPTQNDDYPAAARRHLIDAAVLKSQARWDGAVYLAGYVVECALKAQVFQWLKLTPKNFLHRILELEAAVFGDSDFELLVALSPATRPLQLWNSIRRGISVKNHPNRRYCADGWSSSEAQTALDEAVEIYKRTIAEDVLDGNAPL